MTDTEVSIYFTEAARAITLKPVQEPEPDFFHIIMPMQVD
jgi:DNA polymerase III sliding clamp (beta) subunit (PCNA family)